MSSSTISKAPFPVVCLFGPTAVGKTALLGRLFGSSGEVVNADSMQVYCGLDIGSAKPDAESLLNTPHHLIDILDFREQFTAGDFVRRADDCVKDIYRRGKLPVISGGTAFYFKNFIYGLPGIPVIPSGIREALYSDLDRKGLDILYRELAAADPETAARLHSTDRSRILRALEVYRGTGCPLSEFRVNDVPREGIRFLLLGLERPRKELYERINSRVDLMFRQGLVEEVKALFRRGAREKHPGMKGIGYSEFFPFLREGCLTLDDVKEKIKQDSRRYAKRQMTFFRTLPGVSWHHPGDIPKLLRKIQEFRSSF